ncbi:response regulator [Aeromonas jandaei]|uniref:Response regulator n=1 Tax=Aeromonas jandaei TaxID=650 RepID=A0A7T4ABL2_AERJA|nr:response regulator [Aeromonas jandaei]QQB20861.1 response regulator [Aeromonas jandaei]UCA31669.1 response regulator [Aeromonas jandaei]
MKSILVVDDASSIRFALNALLTEAGFNVVEAEDGQDALIQLSQHRFHLIISDLNMPIMDGLTFLREVKSHPGFRYIPFIMLTTENAPELRQQGAQAGAKVWLTKPFEPQSLLDNLAKVIQP